LEWRKARHAWLTTRRHVHLGWKLQAKRLCIRVGCLLVMQIENCMTEPSKLAALRVRERL
jgi:hypothetical protein